MKCCRLPLCAIVQGHIALDNRLAGLCHLFGVVLHHLHGLGERLLQFTQGQRERGQLVATRTLDDAAQIARGHAVHGLYRRMKGAKDRTNGPSEQKHRQDDAGHQHGAKAPLAAADHGRKLFQAALGRRRGRLHGGIHCPALSKVQGVDLRDFQAEVFRAHPASHVRDRFGFCHECQRALVLIAQQVLSNKRWHIRLLLPVGDAVVVLFGEPCNVSFSLISGHAALDQQLRKQQTHLDEVHRGWQDVCHGVLAQPHVFADSRELGCAEKAGRHAKDNGHQIEGRQAERSTLKAEIAEPCRHESLVMFLPCGIGLRTPRFRLWA